MIQSMTGFGKADAILEGKTIHIEVRSLNSKSMDLSTRVASRYREKEMEIKHVFLKHLSAEKWISIFGWKKTKRLIRPS